MAVSATPPVARPARIVTRWDLCIDLRVARLFAFVLHWHTHFRGISMRYKISLDTCFSDRYTALWFGRYALPLDLFVLWMFDLQHLLHLRRPAL